MKVKRTIIQSQLNWYGWYLIWNPTWSLLTPFQRKDWKLSLSCSLKSQLSNHSLPVNRNIWSLGSSSPNQNSTKLLQTREFWQILRGWGPQTILGHHHHYHHDGSEASVMPFERGRMRCNNGVMFQTGHQPQGHTVMMTKINCSMIMMIIMMMVMIMMNMMTKDDNKYD